MNRRIRMGLAAALVALGGCGEIEPKLGPAVQSGSADFSVYVAMGTSLGAGYSNGGVLESHQRHSYPYLFAQQVAAPFSIPSISDSGLGPLLVLRSYSPLLITRAATPGSPTNLGQPTSYHNMSIPGALLVDVLDHARQVAPSQEVHQVELERPGGVAMEHDGALDLVAR